MYLGDVIVLAKFVVEGVEVLSEVFRRFREANLMLQPKRVPFFRRKLPFWVIL